VFATYDRTGGGQGDQVRLEKEAIQTIAIELSPSEGASDAVSSKRETKS